MAIENYITDTEQLKEIKINGAVLSQLLGVTGRQIMNLAHDGVVSAEPVKENGRKAYPLIKSVSSYCEFQRNRALGRASTDKEAELKQKKLEVDIALKESQNELHRLKTDIQAGRYVAVEEVQDDYEKFFVILKKFLLAMPARVGVLLNGYIDPMQIRNIEKDLNKEILEALNAFIISAIPEQTESKQTE